MVSQKQLPKNWYPSSRSLVGVCLHFDCMRCIWRIFALFGTKVNPTFPLLLQDKPCWWNVFDCTGVVDQSSKLLQRLTGYQPSCQSYLSLWTELLAIKKKYLITRPFFRASLRARGSLFCSRAPWFCWLWARLALSNLELCFELKWSGRFSSNWKKT